MVRLDVKLRMLFNVFQSHERLGRSLINWNSIIAMSTYDDSKLDGVLERHSWLG